MQSRKKLQGKVVANKMHKTVVVEVLAVKRHRKYKKQYTVSKRYKVHDEKNEAQLGDLVEIHEIKPISKEKRWQLISKAK